MRMKQVSDVRAAFFRVIAGAFIIMAVSITIIPIRLGPTQNPSNIYRERWYFVVDFDLGPNFNETNIVNSFSLRQLIHAAFPLWY